MNFLSTMLRDEGGLEYKASIADTVITIIEENPDAKETGLLVCLIFKTIVHLLNKIFISIIILGIPVTKYDIFQVML